MTGPQSPQLASLDDLAGKDVFVRKSSSYWEHLEQLNARFKKEGKAGDRPASRPGGPRGRRPTRDAQCGPVRHCRRRRLQARRLVEDLPEDQGSARPGRKHGRRTGLGDPAEQPAAQDRARRVCEDASPGNDVRQYAAETLPGQHEIRRRGTVAGGDEEVPGRRSTCSGSTPGSTTSTSC